MNPSQAWQAAIGQLQMEMPKAAFDTWVRNTQFVSFEENIFTISTQNDYAKEWLTDRLTSTVVKLLTGIINQSVDVRFTVAELEDQPEDGDDGDIADVEAIFDLPYDDIVGSGIIAIPAYFGRYHLPILGPNLAWMVVGFRQAAYMAGQRSGSLRHRISERMIARWSGMYRGTFRRRKKKAATWQKLLGFVNLIDTEPAWAAVEGETPHKQAHAYQVQMTIPLTATHAYRLKQWLLQNVEAAGSPRAVLELATAISPKELLPDDIAAPKDAIPKNVVQIVRECFAEQLPDADLKSLAQRLHHHIMPPNDQIIITHFFIENLLPLLGPGPAWMLTLLRDRCFYNPKTGEQRNEVTIQGGWSEIADWMGLKQPMTIWRWLHGTKRKKDAEHKLPPLSLFVHENETSERASNFESGKRTFHVSLEELPLAILAELGDYSHNTDWLEELKEIIARMHPMEPSSRVCPLCNRANTPNGIARSHPDDRANAPNSVARLHPGLRANAPNLSSLTLGLKNLSSQDITYLPTSDGGNGIQTQFQISDQASRWKWDFLFAFNPEINPKDQTSLREKADPEIFVVWLIYAYSKLGQGIDSPVMFAVRRAQQGRAEPAEVSRYKHYTALDLHNFLTHYPSGGHWDDLLPQTADKRAQLKRRLCGPDS